MKAAYWLKDNWIALVIIVGIVIALGTQVRSTRQDTERAVESQRAACVRGSERTSLNAAFQREAAKARRAAGDADVARLYDGASNGAIAQIPTRPEHHGDPRVAEVELTTLPGGKPLLKLTDYAKAIQVDGCNYANPL